MTLASASEQIVFRTDASVDIGTGHVMRCLTLAAGLTEIGAQVRFLCRKHNGNLIDLIERQGFAVSPLSTDHAVNLSHETPDLPAHAHWLGCDWQTDAAECRTLITDPVGCIIVDHYALDHRWETSLRDKCCRMMCIDDLADRMHDCDLLLDQNLGRTEDDYLDIISNETRLFLGPKYALLRPEFVYWRNISLARRKKPKLSHILVTMGGVDNKNVTSRVLKILNQYRLETLEQITVVLGPHAPWSSEINMLASEMKVATAVLSGVENMAELMTSCDLAIGAGGATTWERCSLGLPAIQIDLAQNQIFINSEINRSGAAIFCNLLDLEQELVLALQRVSNSDCLRELSFCAAAVTEGKGLQEILKAF